MRFQGCANVSPVPAMSAPSVTQSGVPVRMKVDPEICQPPSIFADDACLLPEERQVVDVVEGEHVAAVEARVAPEARVVVGVEQDVALVARVVLRVAERVGDAELEAVLVAAIGADLQAVVLRVAGVLRQADDAVALVGPQRGDVDAGIRLERARQQLVDVALALQVQRRGGRRRSTSTTKPNGISRCTPADHMYAVGCLNTGSIAVMPNGSDAAPPAPPGLSPMPLLTLTCGWNGGLPPSSIESFSVTRLWKTPRARLDDRLRR